jgi:PAS domain S-box-containing protein
MGLERTFSDDTILVSKTDLQGNITYANQEFINISGYSEKELIHKPHNITRHPDIPKIVFKLLWDTLKEGNEINAYVKNQCKDGDYYWVFANVAPSVDCNRKIVGYHSTRHTASKKALAVIEPLYKKLLSLEKSSGMDASLKALTKILNDKGVSYEEFIFSI